MAQNTYKLTPIVFTSYHDLATETYEVTSSCEAVSDMSAYTEMLLYDNTIFSVTEKSNNTFSCNQIFKTFVIKEV